MEWDLEFIQVFSRGFLEHSCCCFLMESLREKSNWQKTAIAGAANRAQDHLLMKWTCEHYATDPRKSPWVSPGIFPGVYSCNRIGFTIGFFLEFFFAEEGVFLQELSLEFIGSFLRDSYWSFIISSSWSFSKLFFWWSDWGSIWTSLLYFSGVPLAIVSIVRH